MTSPISVVVATYGDEEIWGLNAPWTTRAMRSVLAQTVEPASVERVHDDTLHEARNWGAEGALGSWLVFLDGDDELDPRYLEAMSAAVVRQGPGDWMFQPATLGVHPDGRVDDTANIIPRQGRGPNPLLGGNHLIIGTMVRRDRFLDVGGFEDWPVAEDWDLWLRMWAAGARDIPTPEAVYRVHVRPDSRNMTTRTMGDAIEAIRRRARGR